MPYKAQSSNDIVQRNLKIMFYGKTATWKTETFLRGFPDAALVDSEGNSDMCRGKKEIPEFIQVKTKDSRVAVEVVEDIAKGRLKFKDGRLVRSLGFDSWSVFWSVQQEFAQTNAEKRAEKYHKPGETANATPLDWGLAKRPMKQVLNHINNSPIEFLILIAREKDLYADKPGGRPDEQVKIGVTYDVLKGTDYDMNLIVHMGFDEQGVWYCEATKVQGTLGEVMPIGKKFKKFPYKELFAYAANLKPSVANEKGDVELAEEQAEDANHTKEELIAYASARGIDLPGIGSALKAAGFKGVELDRYSEMIAAIDAVANLAQ